jgi:Tfp pilus assembly protein PilF
MLRWPILFLCLGLAGCAAFAPATPVPPRLFADERFAPPSQPLQRPQEVFALDDAMRTYLDERIRPLLHRKGRQRGLVEALYTRGQLRLDYDTAVTRNAREAFDAKSGNCLSLVIMTAAFAKELELPVRYQTVFVDEAWSRSAGIHFLSGHVNLSLGPRFDDVRRGGEQSRELTIDFLPPAETAGHRTAELSEETIVAMYLNNRSAEALAQDRLDDAYWWARQAITYQPRYLNALNTLAVVYLRHGDLAMARQVLEHALEREPDNPTLLSNLVQVHERDGRTALARSVAARLAAIEPVPPFHYFDLGIAAMKTGDYAAARALFAKEIARKADYHEFHFWLALAHANLGELPAARKQLALAIETSTQGKDRELYGAKLDRLRPRQVY